jgi:hypothetical protein
MSEIVKRKIDAGVIRPKLAMDILGQYVACFNDTTYCDARPATAPAAAPAPATDQPVVVERAG